jgi:acetyl-CoA C-acetyltransferase
MSRFYADSMRWGNKYGDMRFSSMDWRRMVLTDAYDGKAMGNAAELCASVCGVSREEQDAFAVQSYQRSQAAWEKGQVQ